MYVPEKLKLNKFQAVQLPTNRQIFSRFGLFTNPGTQYSGDERLPLHENKADMFSRFDAEDMYRKYSESRQNDNK